MLEHIVKSFQRITTITACVAGISLVGCTPHTPGLAKYISHTQHSYSTQDLILKQQQTKPFDYNIFTWQEAIKAVCTPQQAQAYLDTHFTFELSKELTESFKENHKDAKGVCADYALAAAALLSDDGYPPTILLMADNTLHVGHAVFIYKNATGYGIVGNTPLPNTYLSSEDLRNAFYSTYGRDYFFMASINLDDTLPNREWIDGDIHWEIGLKPE